MIHIDLEVFKDANKTFDKKNIGNNMLKKKEELSKYSCFSTTTYVKSNNNKYNKNYDHNKSAKMNKLHIISANYTENDQIKKSWLGILNKLSEKNKEQYKNKIIDFLKSNVEIDRNDLFISVWDFIKRSPEELYIDILRLFDMSMIDDKWDKYVKNNEWYPTDVILNNNVLSSNDNIYDVYCEYVMWKKHIKNINIGWCIIFKKCNCLERMDVLLLLLIDLFEKYKSKQQSHRHIIDFVLEQILNICNYHINTTIISKLRENNKDVIFQSSSKFIMMDIFEKCK